MKPKTAKQLWARTEDAWKIVYPLRALESTYSDQAAILGAIPALLRSAKNVLYDQIMLRPLLIRYVCSFDKGVVSFWLPYFLVQSATIWETNTIFFRRPLIRLPFVFEFAQEPSNEVQLQQGGSLMCVRTWCSDPSSSTFLTYLSTKWRDNKNRCLNFKKKCYKT